MAVPHASLKIYEPLDAFDPAERAKLLASVSAPVPASVVLSRSSGLAETRIEERADVIERNDRVYVCPHRPRLRLLASLVAFHRSIPEEVVGAFMPAEEPDRAIDELESMRAKHPSWRSHILTSTWEVPVRWFVAFDDSEREIDADAGVLRYRTSMALARARTSRALDAARSATLEGGVTALVSELARWLSAFHDDSVVELDYGDLARLVHAHDLHRDRSAKEIQVAVTALASGDLLKATASYMRAAERWAPLSGLERTN